MATVILTCHTAECMNSGIPLELPYDPEFGPLTAYCGPCGQEITDIEEAES